MIVSGYVFICRDGENITAPRGIPVFAVIKILDGIRVSY